MHNARACYRRPVQPRKSRRTRHECNYEPLNDLEKEKPTTMEGNATTNHEPLDPQQTAAKAAILAECEKLAAAHAVFSREVQGLQSRIHHVSLPMPPFRGLTAI